MLSVTGFETLPGSQQINFEMFCRALIRTCYGRYGHFAALANQPGVEFHLRLHTNCALGAPPRWFGWQCRWYGLASGKALGATRRKKIEQALVRTSKVLPEMTDWVLWTHHPLTKGDQKWYYALKTKMRLALWTLADAEALLGSDAELLRRTYFGELMLTPVELAQQHELSTARIRRRWLPEAHHVVGSERTLRRMLGEVGSWGDLGVVARRVMSAIAVITRDPRAFTGVLASLTPAYISAAQRIANTMQDVHRSLEGGDLDLLRVQLGERISVVAHDIAAVPRKLLGARLACGLYATNALADMKLGMRLLADVDSFLGTRLVGVLADAGGGKTQLAAQLTAALADRPAGILLHGQELHSGRTIDTLAGGVTIQGHPVPSMKALLAALDATGQRARRRLPLVIDGLNEAEDPREWKAALASMDAMLRDFAHVLVVCTVRTGARSPVQHEWPLQPPGDTPARTTFADQALPDDTKRIDIPLFGSDVVGAMQKYFRYFLINPGDAELPTELLSHPLTLRLFCEVTNPERKREVGVEAMPGSLTGLFERYLAHVTERIGQLAPRTCRYYDHDIRNVLVEIGTQLWKAGNRKLPEQNLRKQIGDDARPWNESIVHMLEQEGVILRIPGESPGHLDIVPVYDALGGYLAANAILINRGHTGLEAWLKDPGTRDALAGDGAHCHPLALDIFQSLVGLLPKRLQKQQLWQLVDEPLRSTALWMAAALEGTYLDAATVAAIAEYMKQGQPGSSNYFRRLFSTRGAVEHPLNAEFLDSVLRAMHVGGRDLCWTEWVRINSKGIQKDLKRLERRWQHKLTIRTTSDRLRAEWIMWLMTTTVRNLRDQATRTLYWFGRGDPVALFSLAERAADVNDPYVFERMLATVYGVGMALHCDPRHTIFRATILQEQARRIFDLMFKKEAPARTTHILTREYGRRFIELAMVHNRRLLSKEEQSRVRPPYIDGGRIVWQEAKISKGCIHGVDSPFRMDFENYTLGRLADGRANYDFAHPGYCKIRAQVLWRVQQLGWTTDTFQRVDRAIEAERHDYGRAVDEPCKVDRYGKKYSLIAYCELAGLLKDQGMINRREDCDRTWDVDMDPSFPSPTPEQRVVVASLLGNSRLSPGDWVARGPAPDLKPYLRLSAIRGDPGPWALLDGFVSQQDDDRGRRLFAFVRSFLVAKSKAKEFAACLTRQPLGGRWLPEKPEFHYTFSGEIPWCDTFPKADVVEFSFVVREQKVKARRRRLFFYLDGRPVNLGTMDLIRLGVFGSHATKEVGQSLLTDDELTRIVSRIQIAEVEEVRQEIRRFRGRIPVCDFGWEGGRIEDTGGRGTTLAKHIARTAALVHLPQTLDLQTKEGKRVTYGVSSNPEDFYNSERFFFIREDLLKTLLGRLGMSLVWAVWGDRELSNKQWERLQRAGTAAGVSYMNFQAIHRYCP